MLYRSELDTNDIQTITNLHWNQTAHIKLGDLTGQDISTSKKYEKVEI